MAFEGCGSGWPGNWIGDVVKRGLATSSSEVFSHSVFCGFHIL